MRKVWNTILARYTPHQVVLSRPTRLLFKGLPGTLTVNGEAKVPAQWSIGQDTDRLQTSPLNVRSSSVAYLFGQSGWLPVGDSAEVFVADYKSNLFLARRMTDYIKAQRAARFSTLRLTPNRKGRRKSTSGCGWAVCVELHRPLDRAQVKLTLTANSIAVSKGCQRWKIRAFFQIQTNPQIHSYPLLPRRNHELVGDRRL